MQGLIVANIDYRVVDDFGDEWRRFDQNDAGLEELRRLFEDYFSLFPWNVLPDQAVGFDMGCGSGRWAYFVAPRVGRLHCIDPASGALAVAERKLRNFGNCEFHQASVDALPLADNSMDFGYSLGVLHHVPDTQAGLRDCVRKLRFGAPFLVYLYYAFDNRPAWFKAIWRATDLVRRAVAVLPPSLKNAVTDVIAFVMYLPLSRIARLLAALGRDVSSFPLAAYRDKSIYTLRTDARDRFGTRLEQRFTKAEIRLMLQAAGLGRVQFREGVPYWCAIGYRAA
jgi:SAM-dependent methyltransferase